MNKAEKQVVQHQLSSEKAVLKELEKQYKTAIAEIEERVASLLGRQDADLPHVIRRVEYQNMLKAQVQASLDRLHANEYETISAYLNDSYTDAFVGTMFTLHKQDMPLLLPVDQKAAVKAVTIDSKLKAPLYESLGVDVNKLKQTIRSEITRGIASGLTYSEIARSISMSTKAPLSRAKTITRTEGHRVQQASADDAGRAAKASGADVVGQWDATMDGDTRDTHRKLDGQIREIGEPFEVDGKKAMYPGGFGDPAEDCNCRCVKLTRARSALDEDELRIMQERASYHGLLVKDSKEFGKAKAKDFSDFKKKYLKAAETLEKQGKSGIIKTGKFNTTDDPMREVTGPGMESNPEEIKKILKELESAGVEVVYRSEEMAYSPGMFSGEPGQLIITAEASYSAWLHEYQHFKDDKEDGFPGMRILMDAERCKQREINAYNVEIELAKKLGREDIVERLEALKAKEVSKYDEGADED